MGRKSWQKTLPLKLMNFRDSIVHSCPGHSHSSGHLMRRTLRNHFEHDMLVTEMKEGMSIAKHLKELTDRLAAICAPILQEVQIVTPVLLHSTLNYVQQALGPRSSRAVSEIRTAGRKQLKPRSPKLWSTVSHSPSVLHRPQYCV